MVGLLSKKRDANEVSLKKIYESKIYSGNSCLL